MKNVLIIVVLYILLTGCQKKDSIDKMAESMNFLPEDINEWTENIDSMEKLVANKMNFVKDESLLPFEIRNSLPKYHSSVFHFEDDSLQIFIYCNDREMYQYATADLYTHIYINGKEFILDTLGKSFYLRQASEPKIYIYDINKDNMEDFIFWCDCERWGYIQYTFLSKADGSYDNVGTICWHTTHPAGTEGSYHASTEGISRTDFPYEVHLLDNYCAQIGIKNLDIDETVTLGDTFIKYYADQLGIYDNGKVTAEGREWDFESANLIEDRMSCIIDENADLLLNVNYQVGSGYSTSDIGCSFTITWSVSELGYEIKNVLLYSE